VADERQRDRTIEQMLRRGISAPSSAATNACVDGETLAAWSSGALAREESARVEEHLADCARCQSMLAAFARTEPHAAALAPWWQRAHLRWWVPLATAATVAAIWVAIPPRTEAPQPSAVNASSEGRFAAEPFVAPSQPAPGVSAESAPIAPPSAAAPSNQQRAAPKREAPAAPERKQESTARRPDEADARARTSGQAASELAEARPRQTAPPAAPPSSTPMPAQPADVAAPAEAPTQLARAATVEFASPGDATRWRILAGRVQRSTTQGERWEAVALPAATITAGHSPGPSVAWFVGRAGAIFVTTDGVRFEKTPFVSSADLTSVAAIDDRQATVTTVDGRRFRTTNRGVTWDPQ